MRTMDPFGARRLLDTPMGRVTWYSLQVLEDAGLCNLAQIPYSIRILLESLLRHAGTQAVQEEDVRSLAGWRADQAPTQAMPFMPGRVLMQDFTGVPAVVDLAAMRAAMHRLGGDPARVNPLVPTDLVIDHSVQVDHFASHGALAQNEAREFERNGERYAFLKWAQSAFRSFSVVPPSTGIVHQVNLEYLARVVELRSNGEETLAFPDTVVGTDSHTTMVNGLGVAGWGVGGIEAEAAMLGQPYYMLPPQVVGVCLKGCLAEGVLATDLVLHVTQILRELGVVGKFVEFYGPGLASLSLADRATLANMAPEYGATMGFFPVDARTLEYLRLTGRSEEHVDFVERYLKEQGLLVTTESPAPSYSSSVTMEMGTVVPCLAGPKRPQDRVPLSALREEFRRQLELPVGRRGYGLSAAALTNTATVRSNGSEHTLQHGAVLLAAITSCTNTSNPAVLLAAGLLARKAVERGLRVPPWVKTSFAPGSRVVVEYLREADLLPALETLGFHVVGYGCTTCIGNSGPLSPALTDPLREQDLVAVAVLSGNRNFEGRVNPHTRANYLASPPLVVACALAGTVDRNLLQEPLGRGTDGREVFLRELWPTSAEIESLLLRCVRPEQFRDSYASVFRGGAQWEAIEAPQAERFPWDPNSTYVLEPPFLTQSTRQPQALPSLSGMRALGVFGDSITTDHISPAGAIMEDSPAGKYLRSRGVAVTEFNSYGSRRGNDQLMFRGTFANIRLKNQLVAPREGGWTRHLPSGETLPIYDAALRYREEDTPLILFGGREYGSGSSRDWAAKGTLLLGVRAVLVESFERIHRSNLVGMGVLPLEFMPGENMTSLGLSGEETFTIHGLEPLCAGAELTLEAHSEQGQRRFRVRSRIDTEMEANYYRHGGILPYVLRQLLG